MNRLRMVRTVAWSILALVVVVLAAGSFGLFKTLGLTPGATVQAAAIGGPFALVTQKGEPITEAAFVGHPSVVFFGYTYCPDVCPTTLLDMTNWLKELGADGDRLKAYFVTVDPDRDTTRQMANYLTAFDPRITGITGEPEKIEPMLKAYRVYHRKVDQGGGNYLMDHPAAIYMLNAKGEFAGVINYQEAPDAVMTKLKRLLKA